MYSPNLYFSGPGTTASQYFLVCLCLVDFPLFPQGNTLLKSLSWMDFPSHPKRKGPLISVCPLWRIVGCRCRPRSHTMASIPFDLGKDTVPPSNHSPLLIILRWGSCLHSQVDQPPSSEITQEIGILEIMTMMPQVQRHVA